MSVAGITVVVCSLTVAVMSLSGVAVVGGDADCLRSVLVKKSVILCCFAVESVVWAEGLVTGATSSSSNRPCLVGLTALSVTVCAVPYIWDSSSGSFQVNFTFFFPLFAPCVTAARYTWSWGFLSSAGFDFAGHLFPGIVTSNFGIRAWPHSDLLFKSHSGGPLDSCTILSAS